MNGGPYQEGYREFSAERFEAAERLFAQALTHDPNFAPAHFARGCALQRMNRHEDAIAAFDKALKLSPRDVDAFVNRAVSCMQLSHFAEAAKSFEAVLHIDGGRAEIWLAYGDTLAALKQLEDALAAYAKALAIRPQLPEAMNNRGAALFSLKRYEEAIRAYDSVLALQPDNVLATVNRGIAQAELRRFPEALASFERAIARDPANSAARYHMGTSLYALRRYREALASLDVALAIDPANADAHIVRGIVLKETGRAEEGLAAFTRALAVRPDSVEALVNRQSLLFAMKRYEEAIADCDRALLLDPYVLNIRGYRLYYRMQICDWRGSEVEEADIFRRIGKGERVIQPFANIALSGTPALQLECARIWAAHEYSPHEPFWKGARYRHDRIRVAYISGDFQDHPVLKQMVGVFEKHDKSQFETIAISLGGDDGSEIRRRAAKAFDHFIDAGGKSDFEIARLLHAMEADVAVDLMGFTGKARNEILNYRPAPASVQFLGFPGTTGSKHVDYVLADRIVIPEEDKTHYSEKTVYLPHSFMPHDDTRLIAPAPSRAEAGLPEGKFVFCAYNNRYKYTPRMFDAWMRILKAVPESILWLSSPGEMAADNLKREAGARGIAAGRLVFAPFVTGLGAHLARLSLADVFLDTVPFNAHSTAMDMLFAGVPVLTLIGNTFAGRVSASLNRTAGMPEMVAGSIQEYEEKTLLLARDRARLAATREKLARARNGPLFDTERFTRHLEEAFRQMRDRCERGEAPASFAVEPRP
jgi:protein O-GlcNAc transferase